MKLKKILDFLLSIEFSRGLFSKTRTYTFHGTTDTEYFSVTYYLLGVIVYTYQETNQITLKDKFIK